MGRISSKKRKKTVLLRYSKRGDTVFFLSLPGFQHLFFFFADPQRLSDFLNCFVMCPVIETVFFQQFLCFFRKMNITDRYASLIKKSSRHTTPNRISYSRLLFSHFCRYPYQYSWSFFIKWHVAQELSQIPHPAEFQRYYDL